MVRGLLIVVALVGAGVIVSTRQRAILPNVIAVPSNVPENFAVSGIVRDELGGRPMHGVMIFADSVSGARMSTDSAGRYRLPALTVGHHVIVATRLGYYIERREIGVECEVPVVDASGRVQPTHPCDLSPQTLNFGMRVQIRR